MRLPHAPTSAPMTDDPFDSLLARATRVRRLALVPEIALQLSDDLPTLWAAREAVAGRTGSTAPYWGVAWPGGQSLARFLLDRPALVAGKRVLDLGAGSGLCAIAAALAGAQVVTASDIDRDACHAIARNAALNRVSVTIRSDDPTGRDTDADIVLAADLWYERFFAQRVTGWLRDLARSGREVLMADSGRAFVPRTGIEELARYELAPTRGLEVSETASASVFRFSAATGNSSPSA